jgi:hypothetical protein
MPANFYRAATGNKAAVIFLLLMQNIHKCGHMQQDDFNFLTLNAVYSEMTFWPSQGNTLNTPDIGEDNSIIITTFTVDGKALHFTKISPISLQISAKNLRTP